MIYIFTGKTGSGKSLESVNYVYKKWKQGTDVWSNTPLFFTSYNNGFGGENIRENPKHFTFFEKVSQKLSDRILSKLLKKPFRYKLRGKINYFDRIDEVFYIKNAVIFFDEGQTLFRNYDWESVPRLFLYKLEQNRKHGLDLVTTAQRLKAVNINYRELIQVWQHFKSLLPEKFEKFLKIHLYTKYKMDSDLVTEQYLNMGDLLKPKFDNFTGEKLEQAYEKKSMRLVGFWNKRLYDTMYDIGFEPLQHYDIKLGNQNVKLGLESGMTVKQAITLINTYKRLIDL